MGTLPAFSFVTPNAVDDIQNGTVAQGHTWLSKNVPVILKSSAFTSRTASATLFNHYSLLLTTESLLHLPALGLAGKSPNVVSAFNL